MMNIGKTIQTLRKQKGVTQEDLGSAVNVTTQAVSKWENGGTPDATLLPVIADYFQVSVDYLFGRTSEKEMALKDYVFQQIHKLPLEERNYEMYKVCHAMTMACSSIDNFESYFKTESLRLFGDDTPKLAYHLSSDNLISYLSLMKKTPYCVFFPESQEGYKASFAKTEEYQDMFSFLGQKNVLEVLIEAYHFPESKGFTAQRIAKQCKLQHVVVENILQEMHKREWIIRLEVEANDDTLNVYMLHPNLVFIPFMIFAEEFIHPTLVGYCLSGREKPILHHNNETHGELKK